MKLLALFLAMGLLFSGNVYADSSKYDGTVRFVYSGLPKFEDWPAETPPKTLAQDIDWKSHPAAWSYRARLREGLKEGPNFGGRYIIVTHGCGSNCQVNWIIDAATGKVISDFVTANGVMYRSDSRMIIADLPYDDFNPDINVFDEFWTLPTVKFFVVSDGHVDISHTLRICSSPDDSCSEKSKQ